MNAELAEIAIAAFDSLALVGDAFARGIIFAEMTNAYQHGAVAPILLMRSSALLERAQLGSVVLRRKAHGAFSLALLGWRIDPPDANGDTEVPGIWVSWPPDPVYVRDAQPASPAASN